MARPKAASAFVRKPALPGVQPPSPLLRPPVRRKGAMIAKAPQILDHLPGPGESLHAVVSGRRVDAAPLLAQLVERFGAEGATLHLASLSMSRANLRTIVGWMDKGASVTLLVSTFFHGFNRAFWRDDVLPAFAAHPGCRAAHALNHCKVAALSFADGGRWSMEGSANLKGSGGGNWEQFSLINDAVLHDFHAGWIAQRVASCAAQGEGDAAQEG